MQDDRIHPEVPSPKEFFLELGLYANVRIPNNAPGNEAYKAIIFGEQTLDGYCPYCESTSVLQRNGARSPDSDMYICTISCTRNRNHVFEFYVHHDAPHGNPPTFLKKIGQLPSAADLQLGGRPYFKKALGEDSYREYRTAVGLFAHGVGIGSFVYLRRVFERLVEEARVKASQESGWDQESYNRSRMDEKIQLLKDHLPQLLVENRSLYGILSKGIHELSEKECLALFPAVRGGIDIIAEEKWAAHQKAQETERAKAEIEKARRSLSE